LVVLVHGVVDIGFVLLISILQLLC